MTRRSPLRRRSKNPRATTRLALWNALSRWVRAEGVCFYCGRNVGPSNLEAHHLITKGSDKSLSLYPGIAVPACKVPDWPRPSCHDRARVLNWLVEQRKPGYLDHLRRLSRTEWFRKPIDEVEDEIAKAVKVPWSEYWASLEAA